MCVCLFVVAASTVLWIPSVGSILRMKTPSRLVATALGSDTKKDRFLNKLTKSMFREIMNPSSVLRKTKNKTISKTIEAHAQRAHAA